jgi:hypothetical protein
MPGPNTAAVPEPLITTVRISDGEITAVLTDGPHHHCASRVVLAAV